LQTVALSQNLSIITPSQQATNPQSLTAFAQSMGLDEHAISQLMAKASQSSSGSPTAGLPNANGALSAMTPSANALSATSASATMGTAPITPSATLMAALNMQSSASDAPANVDATASNINSATIGNTPAATTQQILNAQNALQAANPLTATQVSAPIVAATPAPTTPTTPAMPTGDWQAQAQAQALVGTTTTSTASPVATKSTTSPLTSTDWIDTGLSEQEVSSMGGKLSLNLTPVAVPPVATPTAALGIANTNAALGMSLPTSTNTGSTATQASANAPTEAPNAAKQLETIDALSDKLANEMAGRINKQLADGQWKMKFGLRPANLGGVEIQLEMNDGKLNTHFNVDNPVTAHLLQNASDRLRSTLESFGIQPGQVQVGSQAGGGQQNPSQQSTNTSQFVDNSGGQAKTSQEETTEQPTSGRQDSSSGLDLYA
jgi:flagellar hook-length control protein FliK